MHQLLPLKGGYGLGHLRALQSSPGGLWGAPMAKKKSHLEESFAQQLDALGIAYEREQRLIPGRRFRFDFVIAAEMLVVEIEGGTWMARSRHTSGKGFQSDCWKYNSVIEMGYAVLRYTSDMVTSGDAAAQVARYLAAVRD